jgi:hypothetical protein
MLKFRNHWRILTSGLVVLSTAAVFQNCTTQSNTKNASAKNSVLATTLPFAYDAAIDQIAYSSCSEVASGLADRSQYFSFRVGAYRDGSGLMVNSAFTQAIAATANTAASSGGDVLSSSAANTNTQLQIAIRGLSNYQQVFAGSGAAPVDGNDFAEIFAPLGTTDFSNYLFSLGSGVRSRYVRDQTAMGLRMEGDLHFDSSFNQADSMRQSLSGQSTVLGVTYQEGPSFGARAPSSFSTTAPLASRSVYGMGYQIHFRQPTLFTVNPNFPNYTLRDVTELSLQNSGTVTGHSWSCPANLQFRILPSPGAVDLQAFGCQLTPDPAFPDSWLQMVRLSYRAEDWYVDMTNHCLIPKNKGSGTSCYGSATGIVHDMTQACTGPASSVTCVHFGSICYRN